MCKLEEHVERLCIMGCLKKIKTFGLIAWFTENTAISNIDLNTSFGKEKVTLN